MKFAHSFKASLATQDFPERWVEHAVPYGQLKKCLKKVQRELRDIGLDPETLRALLTPGQNSSPTIQYMLSSTSDSKLIRPKLIINVQMRDGVVVDASLAPASRNLLQGIARELFPQKPCPENDNETPLQIDSPANPAVEKSTASPQSQGTTVVEVPLVFDGEFFGMLQGDVDRLDVLQAQEGSRMVAEIEALGKEVSLACRTKRFHRNDLERWRRIFELYLDAEVFFATHEQDHGARSSPAALRQLQWFQAEVEKHRLVKNFKLRESKIAFDRFLKLNVVLLKSLQFQELNKLAVYKILKKFDKRTALGVAEAFPVAVQSDRLLADSVAKDVCAHISKEMVSVVPQVNDYLCPICVSIYYLPVRLACRHVFCIRCMIKVQRRKERHCPLCRADVVMKASAENVDLELEKFLKKNFPVDVKEKQRANEIERAMEDYGPGHIGMGCSTM
ncbi:hypothetical protein S40288_05614 [Stachybotrys chartarum IBT 40288]|nr:hypothetical protein S40288_05614 [Stachybotrys chartarum IBT 40288]